ncbi:MAG: hypothetical protein UT12_C0012G0008 [Candidatus Curtissbacteria bacterium GW2011_GWC2_38_9]|uniref:Uncharacterized protein n=3 Tax=Candidatus Curtissiibacteriota TaxID=1752717 RepID=A0A1F5HQS1_9BACT|nr:MAG: hypothetical protein UT12_C0012G0008 [Candidatus Curtissbacteria bacterium GW2011_GWC2_38_9]KKS04010.1 MAG: hypothetical protein UU56_C0011G0004 [Candidatus Curtissbacteria bacterium GW2011_GWA2_41_24]OGE06413.1 MAG: hypothetical protein A2W70_00930 [Candidatus Curtissbacteria bacterium RIFCSPLOWO2_02_41_11]
MPVENRNVHRVLSDLLVRSSRGALREESRHLPPQLRSFPELQEESKLAEEVRLAQAAVWDSDEALKLISQLYGVGAITMSDYLAQGVTPDLVAGMGILAKAQYCEVDKSAIRITISGMRFVEDQLRDF